jgi:hypothetical protein
MRFVLLLVPIALISSCELGLGIASLGDLGRARRRWEATRPLSYEYAIERLCFCPVEYLGPARIRVAGDSVVERSYTATGDPVPELFAAGFPSVDGLFAILAEAYERGAHEVEVTYDPETGVPLEFFIDDEENAADDENGMRVTERVTPVAP